MLLMVLIDAIVGQDIGARLDGGALGLVGLIPDLRRRQLPRRVHGGASRRLRVQRPADRRASGGCRRCRSATTAAGRAATCSRGSAPISTPSSARSSRSFRSRCRACLMTIVVGVVLLLVVEWRLATRALRAAADGHHRPALAGRASEPRELRAPARRRRRHERDRGEPRRALRDQGVRSPGHHARRLRTPAGDALSKHRARQLAERPPGDVDQRQRIDPADRRDHGRRGARRAGRAVGRRPGGGDRPALVHRRQPAGACPVSCRRCSGPPGAWLAFRRCSTRPSRSSTGRARGRCRAFSDAIQLHDVSFGYGDAAPTLSQRDGHDSRRRIGRHRRSERIGQEHAARPAAASARPDRAGRLPSTATTSAT